MSLSDERNPYRQTAEKRFYFAKLPENFFEDKKIKYLLTQQQGDGLVVLYLKILCKSLRNNGALYFDGMLDFIEEEIALEVGADAAGIKDAVKILKQAQLISESQDGENRCITIPRIDDILTSETDAARRKRNQRARERAETETTLDPGANPFRPEM